MRALVTGAASFIGTHLTDALQRRGDTLVAVDGIFDNYPAAINLAEVDSGLDPIEADLATADVVPLLNVVDEVFHVAGQPGARASWGTGV